MRSWCWDPDFRDRRPRKNPKLFVSRQKNQSQLWIPRQPRKIGVWVSGAEIQTSAVDTRTAVWVSTAEKFSKIVLGKTQNFSRMFRGVSAPALYKNPAVIIYTVKKIRHSKKRGKEGKRKDPSMKMPWPPQPSGWRPSQKLVICKTGWCKTGLSEHQGRKKPWQPETWQDLTRFSPLDFSLLSLQVLGGSSY